MIESDQVTSPFDTSALQHKMTANSLKAVVEVCFWHNADMLNAPTNVRFWGQSGHSTSAN
jgi:hypothetical protein